MNKLLSNWSGRLVTLLVATFLAACFLAPVDALATKEIRIGRDLTGGGEGDPLDTNDCGGGGGGSDVHDDGAVTAYADTLVFGFDGLRIVLLPQVIDGKVVFRILLIPAIDSDTKSVSVEGYHAP